MIKKHNNTSLGFGIPGLILQCAGDAQNQLFVMVCGGIMLFVSFVFYAKARGRSPLWGLLSLFSLFGILGLGLLEDRSQKPLPYVFGVGSTEVW